MPKTLRQTGYRPQPRDLSQFEGATVLIQDAMVGVSPSYGKRATLAMQPVDPATGEALGDQRRVVTFGEAVLEVIDHLLGEGLLDGTVANAVIVRVVREGDVWRLVDPDESESAGDAPRTSEA